MKLLLLNYPYLKKEYEKLGAEVITVGPYDECDFVTSDLSYEKVRELTEVDTLNAVIYSDALDGHILATGLDNYKIPKIYITVDSVINHFWQKYYAKCFDTVFFDDPSVFLKSKDYIPNVNLLLLGFDSDIFKGEDAEKVYDVLFVGREDLQFRPKRKNIIDLIQQAGINIKVFSGEEGSPKSTKELSKLYSQSKIVLNENLFPSINLRLFEILGSGALCFTEDNCEYLKYYFEDKKQLVTYNSDNLISRLKYYLENNDEREKIAQLGKVEAHKNHTDVKRAESVLAVIKTNKKLPEYNHRYLALAGIYQNLKWQAGNHVEINNKTIVNFIKNPTPPSSEKEIYEDLLINFYVGQKEYITGIANIAKFHRISDPLLLNFLLWYFVQENNIEKVNSVISRMKELAPELAFNMNSDNLTEYACYVSALFLSYHGHSINYGLTRNDMHPYFCSAFDYWNKLTNSQIYSEIAYRSIIDILENSKAYDFAYQACTALHSLKPNDFKIKYKLDYLKKKSYL